MYVFIFCLTCVSAVKQLFRFKKSDVVMALHRAIKSIPLQYLYIRFL